MKRCAEKMDFERAAKLRDLTGSLSKTIAKTRRFTRGYPGPVRSEGEDLADLVEQLELDRTPTVIECFDALACFGNLRGGLLGLFRRGKALFTELQEILDS